jgi:hypothetical protein
VLASRQKATASADRGKPKENSRRGVERPDHLLDAYMSMLEADEGSPRSTSPEDALAALTKRAPRLAAALEYAKRGMYLFPVNRRLVDGRKVPAISGWQAASTTDPTQLAKWFGRPAPFNLGIDCAKSGIIVFDTDQKEGRDGEANFRALAGEHVADLDNTFTVESPTGSRHYYVKGPAVRSSVSKIADAVDIRSAGGFVVGASSDFGKGPYRVINTAPVANISTWQNEAIARHYVQSKRVELAVPVELNTPAALAQAAAYLEHDAPAAPEGSRGDTAYRVAARLKDFGVDEFMAGTLMVDWNDRCCTPPLDEAELLATVEHAYTYGENSPGSASVEADFEVLPDEEADAIGDAAANDNGGDDTRRKAGTRVLTSGEFVASIRAPNWLIRGIVRRRFFYTLTAATGTGKTALSLLLAASVALGRAIGEHRVSKGRVLYLAGENPDDIGTRWIAMAEKLGFDPAAIDTRFVAGVVDIRKALPVLRENAEAWGGFDLIIVDTVAAYSTMIVKDENDNAQMGAFAEVLRRLVELPGGPCVIACAHPTKGVGKTASPDELMPRGGGAFIAAVDGNLTLNADADNDVIYLRHNKLRGPGFDKLAFKLDTIETDRIVTEDGERMPTVVARHIGEDEEIARRDDALVWQDEALRVIVAHPLSSLKELAGFAGWKKKDGTPDKRKMQTAVDTLEGRKLVKKISGHPEATRDGKKYLAARDDRLFGDDAPAHGLN